MPVPDFTFDLTPARRPSLADAGGATKINKASAPPNPQTMATAEEHNAFAKAYAGYGAVVPVARIRVDIIAGVPTVMAVAAPRSSLTTASFTVNDNGAGDFTLFYATGILPPTDYPPKAYITEDGAWLQPVVLMPSATSMQVKTRADGGALTDANVVIEVY